MHELTKEQYLETMVDKMKKFNLTKATDQETILEIAADILKGKSIQYTDLVLSDCYENGYQTYSHYLVSWGIADEYIVIIANDIKAEWHGFYQLNLKKEYDIIDAI